MKKYDHNSEPRQLSLFGDENVESQEEADEKVDATYDLTSLFQRLSQSAFRSRFHLTAKERAYIEEKGMATIRRHAEDFVSKRLAPAAIPNDGKQTPMRGHPVFLAQHATGCCCRGCLSKWHHIQPGHQLSPEEQRYVVAVLMTWIRRQLKS
jgi:exodeoxyribonuclease V alpha subunit